MDRIVLALVIIAAPQLYAADTPLRPELDLCGKWHAAVDPNNVGESQQWYDLSVELPEAADINVPGSFANISGKYSTYKGPGWFRRSFDVPAAWEGKRVVVHFEAVNDRSKVWVNGKSAGENPDAFLPFELDISRLLNYGQTNYIAVKADTTRRTDTNPGGRIGWHEFGGIIREVKLVATNPVFIDKCKVSAEPSDPGGIYTITATVRNNSDKEATARLHVLVIRAHWGGQMVSKPGEPFTIGPHGQTEVAFSDRVEWAQPWSPQNPARVSTVVYLSEEPSGPRTAVFRDSVSLRFGFRKIEVKDATLYLNGKPILLTGFNRHEDSPRTDICPDHRFSREELHQMKREYRANFIRLCHYPQHPEILDMCDQVGLLVMCEIPLYMWQGVKESGDEYHQVYEATKRQLEKLIERDYNHPSVIMWSVSNETWPQYLEVVGANAKLVAHAKRLDPTRLALHVSDHWRNDLPDGRSRQDHFGEDDVIGINGYPHSIFRKEGKVLSFWHDDVRGAAFDPNLIAEFWSDGLDMLHAEYPNKPVLVTEYGWRSDRGHRQQAQFIAAGAHGMKKPWLCGATIWCWADHPWSSQDQMRLSPYGIYTRERKPKSLAVAATKEAFSELREYFETLHADAVVK